MRPWELGTLLLEWRGRTIALTARVTWPAILDVAPTREEQRAFWGETLDLRVLDGVQDQLPPEEDR